MADVFLPVLKAAKVKTRTPAGSVSEQHLPSGSQTAVFSLSPRTEVGSSPGALSEEHRMPLVKPPP